MASPEVLTLQAVVKYIQENGGKISNHELVKHFRSYLNDETNKEVARLLFKDIVNTVSTVQKDGDEKYLILKSQYLQPNWQQPTPDSVEDVDVRRSQAPADFQPEIVHSLSSPSILETLQDGQTPQPPPRRKGNSKQRGTKIEEKVQQLSQERETSLSPRNLEEEIAASPVSVKERAQKLNKMATSESDLTLGVARKREAKGTADDEDAVSLTVLEPRTKAWMIKAAQTDYTALLVLLRDEPRLASYKDFLTGYTALHWAAKFGKGDIVKLIAGTHNVNTNILSHGGYTALHIAYMFNQLDIVELLTKAYGADPEIRDYSGKLPHQYLPEVKTVENSRRARQPKPPHHHHVWSSEFIRIGSLNSKVRKTAAALTGSRSIGRIKSWGSADSLSDQLSMPPPKFPTKKKRSKKVESSSEKLNKIPSDSDTIW